MGSVDSSGEKQGTFLEGEKSQSHTHNDGSKGYDVEAYRNTYKDGHVVHREKAADWGKEHRSNSSDSGSGSGK